MFEFLISTTLIQSDFIFDQCPAFDSTSSLQKVIQFQEKKEFVEFEDGSRWKISVYDRKKISSWSNGQDYSITQNTRWFTPYNYRILNRSLDSSAEAALSQVPKAGGEKTKHISSIDVSLRSIILSNGTHWKIHPEDLSLIQNWDHTVTIFIGDNCQHDHQEWPNILIPVKTPETFIRAQQFL